MKKILFYTTFLTQGGGLEVATEKYMSEFIKRGYQIHLYVDYNMGKDNIREKNIDKNVKIIYLKSERLSKLIYNFRTKGKLNKVYNIFLYFLIIISDYFIWKKRIKEISKEKYDITITFFQFLPSYITKIEKTTHIIFLHGSVNHFFEGMRKYFKKNFFKKLSKFSYICAVSQEIKEEIREMKPELNDKCKVIYNPIDDIEIEKKSKESYNLSEKERRLLKEKYICSVGRVDEKQKDFKSLILAYNELVLENKIEEKLIIVGDGPNMVELKTLVEEKKLKEKVFFVGKKKNPYIWMKNSEIVVLSSKFEGFGLVILEALILQKKVIASNCKVGPKEILENGKYGELFSVGNIRELKEKIIKTLKNVNKSLGFKQNSLLKYKTGIEKIEKIMNKEEKWMI